MFSLHPLASLLAVAAGSVSLASAALTYRGVDWSSLLVEEAAGQTYSTVDGTTEALEDILVASGVNIVRQRLWYDPSGDDYDLSYNLELAARAKAAGLDIYLDIFFSDTWTDPSDQATPSQWASYDIDDLAAAVQSYTESTMNSFSEAGISLAIVAIGNEITDGLLYPLGEMDDSTGEYDAATLLHAASAGIRASALDPKILIHTDNGWDWDTQEWWYETILAQGPFTASDYDYSGVSYYPFYNDEATFTALQTSLDNLYSAYSKPVLVVETNWPQSCPDPEYAFPSDTTSIPFSAAGQTEWLQDVASIVKDASGVGVFYWEPAWIDNADLGSSCANNLMFSASGQALSSMAVFADL